MVRHPPGDHDRHPSIQQPIDPAAWAAVVREFALSPQQACVVELVLQGKRDKEIANAMSIGMGTVRTHLSRVFLRTGARDRVELVVRVFAAIERLRSDSGRQQS